MATTEALKVAVQEAIDRRGPELIEVAQTILHHPEPGFREQKTSQLTARKFREFGIPFQDGIALTGLKGMLETRSAHYPSAVAWRCQLRLCQRGELVGQAQPSVHVFCSSIGPSIARRKCEANGLRTLGGYLQPS